MKAAIYARVSTKDKQNIAMQTTELREYCQRRGWEIAGEYLDVGVSGSKEKRPQLDLMMTDAHRRRFDAVAVWRFDRFARSVSHLLRALETFNSLGVAFVSLSESIDTGSPVGMLIFTVLAAVAQLERSLIVERICAGLRHAKAKGVRLGRPKLCLDVARIVELRGKGRSWRQIARAMGASSKSCRKAFLTRGKSREEVFATPPNKDSDVGKMVGSERIASL